MKKLLFAKRVKCSLNRVLSAAFALASFAELDAQPYGQMTSPAAIQDPAYAYPQAPNYPANGGAYSPGNYQPPTVSSRPATKPKVSKQARPQQNYAANNGSIEAAVENLEESDKRQDQRLHHLERDVSNMKSSGSYRPPAISPSAHYISKPSSNVSNTGKLHTVREGETLWRIAAKYNTSVNEIRAANNISGNSVAVGRTLLIPNEYGTEAPPPPQSQTSTSSSSNIHLVKKGQTFEEIARIYKVSPDALARVNPSVYPDKLLIGERLAIPGRKASSGGTVYPSTGGTRPPATVTGKSRTHVVRPGQSLGAIAKSYGISTARLTAANKIKNPNLVEVGQILVIPGPTVSTSAPPAPTKKPVMPKMATTNNNTSRSTDTIPLPGAGMPTSKPARVQPPVKPTPPPAFDFSSTPPPPAPEPSRKAPAMPVGSHRGVVAYRLERGDDIDSVANMFSTTPDKIRELNKLGPDAKMGPGDELVVPAMGPVSVN